MKKVIIEIRKIKAYRNIKTAIIIRNKLDIINILNLLIFNEIKIWKESTK